MARVHSLELMAHAARWKVLEELFDHQHHAGSRSSESVPSGGLFSEMGRKVPGHAIRGLV